MLLMLVTVLALQEPVVSGAIRAFEARRYAEARPALQANAKADPRAPLYLGRLELLEGDAAGAVPWLEQAVKAAPSNAEAHRWLGRAYARQARRAGRLRQASLAGRVRESFETAVKLDPADLDARRDLLQFYLVAPRLFGGGRDKAQAQQKAIAARSPMHGRLAAAWIAEAAGDDAAARRELEALVAAYPDSADPALALGALQQRVKQWAAALDTYRALLERVPSARDAHYQVGRIAASTGTALDEGAAALERFIASPAGEEEAPLASAWLRLGTIRERQGDAARARAAYQKALALDRGLDDAKSALKRVS